MKFCQISNMQLSYNICLLEQKLASVLVIVCQNKSKRVLKLLGHYLTGDLRLYLIHFYDRLEKHLLDCSTLHFPGVSGSSYLSIRNNEDIIHGYKIEEPKYVPYFYTMESPFKLVGFVTSNCEKLWTIELAFYQIFHHLSSSVNL